MHEPWMPYPADLSLLMGRLLERSETVVDRLDRIDRRLQVGDTRMSRIQDRLAAIESRKAVHLPGWERALKAAVPYLIALATLAATGSADLALKILDGAAGK